MKPLVMIIDDDCGIVNLLSVILKNNDYDVLTASDGISALNLLNGNISPDIIITDYGMPRLNGSELIEKIYNYKKLKDIPAIIITSSDPQSIDLPRTANYSGIVYKPFKIDTILQKIDDFIKEDNYHYSA